MSCQACIYACINYIRSYGSIGYIKCPSIGQMCHMMTKNASVNMADQHRMQLENQPLIYKLWVYLKCFYNAGYNTVYHDGIEHAGYMAFLGLLSLFPFLVFMVAIAGLFGNQELGQEFVNVVFGHLPDNAIRAIEPRIHEIVSGPPQSILTIAILGVIWTASSSVEGLRTILNRAYRVSTPPAYPLRRLMSILQMMIATVIIIGLMLGLVFVPILYDFMAEWLTLPEPADYLSTISMWLTGLSLLLVVSSIYYFLPNIRQSFVRTLPGALIVVLLWVAAASIFSYYLSQFDQVNLIYGSLGGIIATLLFFYIASVILIFGAELNYSLEKAAGHYFEEKEHVDEDQKGKEAD